MTKKLFYIVLFLGISGCLDICGRGEKKIIQGTIQFPHAIAQVPDIRIYFAGNKIGCETDHDAKQVRFSLPVQTYQDYFFLLITEHIQFEAEENTIKYLKIDPDQPYKFYALELVDEDDNPQWDIKEQDIAQDTCRIPDATIIICFNPDYIDRLSRGTGVSLPLLIVHQDLLKRIGSEDKLHDRSCELLLACLDCDTMHSSFCSEVKQGNPCKTLVLLDS